MVSLSLSAVTKEIETRCGDEPDTYGRDLKKKEKNQLLLQDCIGEQLVLGIIRLLPPPPPIRLVARFSLVYFSSGSWYKVLCRPHPIIYCIKYYLLTVPPLSVHLLGADQPLSAGKEVVLTCLVLGSRPPPVLTWQLDDRILSETLAQAVSHAIQRIPAKPLPSAKFI